jgi:hypothetical protein
VTAIRGDHVGVEIADDRRAAELLTQPARERAVDRRVLPSRSRGRGACGDPVSLTEQIAPGERVNRNRRDKLDRPLPHDARRDDVNLLDDP